MTEVLAAIKIAPDLIFINLIETKTGNPYKATAFEPYGADPTLIGEVRKGWGIRWNHRAFENTDCYFISNQERLGISLEMSFRMKGKVPEFWHPDTGKVEDAPVWRENNGRTIVPYDFEPAGSVFVVFRRPANEVDQIVSVKAIENSDIQKLKLETSESRITAWSSGKGEWDLTTQSGKKLQVCSKNIPVLFQIEGSWDVEFPLLNGKLKKVQIGCGSWTDSKVEAIKYFSGTATYKKEVDIPSSIIGENQRIFLHLGEIKNLATIKINGKELGVIWKPPYSINITNAVKTGMNKITIEVTNTWKNKLIRDAGLPENERETWVAGNIPSADAPLVPAGLIGPVYLYTEMKIKPF